MGEVRRERKEVKKTCKRVAFGVLLYHVIVYSYAFLDHYMQQLIFITGLSDPATWENEMEIFVEQWDMSGTSMIIAVLLGLLLLWIWFLYRVSFRDMFQQKKSMTLKKFLLIFCVFMGCQFVFDKTDMVLEAFLNHIGYTAERSMESASAGSDTFTVFLYSVVAAPIVEELTYRGFVLRSLEKYGKIFAIVISSVLFGVMHCNLPQSMFAFGVGLILGYVAVEYSIVWSILMHICNNLLSDVVSFICKHCTQQVEDVMRWCLLDGIFWISLIIVFCNRKQIKQYLCENKSVKKRYLYAFTTVGMILFIGLHFLLGVSMLEEL